MDVSMDVSMVQNIWPFVIYGDLNFSAVSKCAFLQVLHSKAEL